MTNALGLLAAGLIMISATSRGPMWLRLFGVLGSLAYAAYGVVLVAWPLAVSSAMTMLFHLRHLLPHCFTGARTARPGRVLRHGYVRRSSQPAPGTPATARRTTAICSRRPARTTVSAPSS